MKFMEAVLAIDQGTTSCRALLVSKEGHVIAVCQKEFTQMFPKPGFVEHDAMEIFTIEMEVVKEVVQKARLDFSNIVTIGITNQRETTVLWDKTTGIPVANAIVWQDRRTQAMCRQMKKEGVEKMVSKQTGLLCDPYFSGTKIKWLLDNNEKARHTMQKGNLLFGTIDTWLIWKMTDGKVHVTDHTNASRTLLYNLHTKNWDDELLKLFNVPRSILPEIKFSSEVYGKTSEKLFPVSIPISGIAGDQQAALFGQNCFERGDVKTTYGTGCFMLLNTKEEIIPSKNRLITTVGISTKDTFDYALEGSVFIGGAAVQWLKEGLKMVSSYDEVEKLARQITDVEGVYFVPAMTGLGAPHWDPLAKGMICGITRATTNAHIARATLQGIAFMVADVLFAMRQDYKKEINSVRVDGGASKDSYLMQFQADLLAAEIIRPKELEITALGVSFLAGLACGFWSSVEEIKKLWQEECRFVPKMDKEKIKHKYALWQKAVEACKHFHLD